MMKKLFSILFIFFLGIIAWGCSEDYDDSALWKEINDLKAQVEKLNTDLAKVQSTVTKLESGKYVTDYTKTETGCVLTFSDGSTVTIENGKAGADAPVIGIKDNNGIYYWTLTINGETNWLTTPAPDNKMIPVSGKSPVMGVDADGYWTVDGIQLKDDNNNPVKAGVDAALSIFTGSEETDENVTLTLASGDKLVLPKTGKFAITISMAKAEFAYGQKQTFAVKMNGVEKTTFTKPDGWKVDLANNTLTVTAPVEANTYADTAGVIAIIGMSGNSSCMAEMKVVCGKDGKVLYSTDGGTTWNETAPARNTIGDLLIIKSTYGATLTSLTNVCARTKFTSYDLSDLFIADADAARAFASNKTVTSVILPKRMTHLPDGIFSNCTALTDITYPQCMTYMGAAFGGCPYTSFVVPEGVDTLQGTFSGLSQLTSVKFPSTLKYIGASTFNECSALASLKFPTKQTRIESKTFYKCSALASVELPSTLTDIADEAFYGSGLTSIKLPSTLKYIGESAFAGMNALTKIEIPEGVTYLGKMMFYFYPDFGVGTGTSSLQEITIPSTVTDWQMGPVTTGSYWFFGCKSLQKIICHVVTPVEASTGDWGDFKDVPSSCVIYVPDASVDAYKATEGWQDFTIKGISEL